MIRSPSAALARLCAVLLMCACAIPRVDAQPSLLRQGRPVQCDGFLLEWIERDARLLGDTAVWWDAMQTPDGLAGYVRFRPTVRCAPDAVRLMWSDSTVADFGVRTVSADSALYTARADSSTREIVLEFSAPLDRFRLDSTGAFSASLVAIDTCGSLLGASILRGQVQRQSAWQVVARRVQGQVLLIAGLLAVYLFFYLRIRQRTRRTQSPRQSA
jgi:hypothetical protein